jgi:hypothetical protein
MDEKSSSLTSASADILIRYYDVDRDLERESLGRRDISSRASITVAAGAEENAETDMPRHRSLGGRRR